MSATPLPQTDRAPRGAHPPAEPYYERFSLGQRWQHLLLIASFTVLLLTGLPQKYRTAEWSQLILSTPERVTLYYTEAATRMSTTRTDEQLDAARDEVLALAARIRSGDFRATPSSRACGWCDYRAICPSRAR